MMIKDDGEQLATHSLLANLTSDEFALVSGVAEQIEFQSGEVLVAEGARTRTLLLLKEGEVEVLKAGSNESESFKIAKGDRGTVLGEMSFLDGKPASATVKAKTPTVAWSVSREKLMQAGGEHAIVGLAANLAQVLSGRLREADESLVRSLREKILFAQLFVVVVMLLGICSVAGGVLKEYLKQAPTAEVFMSVGTVLLLLIPAVFFALRNRIPPGEFGLNYERWQSQILQGILFALPLVFGLPVYMYLTGYEIVWFGKYMENYPDSLLLVYFVLYLPHSFLQELVARGIVQGSLQRFMNESHPTLAVGLTSVLFGIAHIHHGIVPSVMIVAISLYFGYIYLLHRSLIGVSITHYVTGFSAMAVGFM